MSVPAASAPGLETRFLDGQGVHLFGDIDVWYYDMPAPTARRCRLPCAPCRDDELRFDVGACLGGAPFFPGRRAARRAPPPGIGRTTLPAQNIKLLRGAKIKRARGSNLTRRPRPQQEPLLSWAGSR